MRTEEASLTQIPITLDALRGVAAELGTTPTDLERAMRNNGVPLTLTAPPKYVASIYSNIVRTPLLMFGAGFALTKFVDVLRIDGLTALVYPYALLVIYAMAQRGRFRYVRTAVGGIALWAGVYACLGWLFDSNGIMPFVSTHLFQSLGVALAGLALRDLAFRVRARVSKEDSGGERG